MFITTLLAIISLVCRVEPSTLHLVGDSQCAGAATVVSKAVEAKEWSHIKSTCKVGSSTQQWHTKIDEVGIQPGDAVVVFLGSNDWYRKPDPKPILDKLHGTKCVWVGPPDMPKHKGPAADHLKKEVEADGTCAYLDSRELRLKLPDGVHTSEPGRWLAAALKRL